MTAIGGMGLLVKIDISATLTTIASMIEGEIPEFEKFLAEATPHNATSGYAQFVATGKFKMNEFKVTLAWDKDDSTHAAIRTAFNSTSAVSMSVVSPGSDETIAFSAFINKLGRVAEQEDYYKCEVTITPTGAPTIS